MNQVAAPVSRWYSRACVFLAYVRIFLALWAVDIATPPEREGEKLEHRCKGELKVLPEKVW
jgi:hypothetical protein